MNHICPVCKKESKETRCERCGFEMPISEKIIQEEAKKWFKDTVLPFRNDWLNRDRDGAIKYYSEAIQENRSDTSAYISRGNAYWYLGKFDEAIENYDQVINLDAKNKTAYINRGLAQLKKKKFDQAIGDFDQTLQLDPDNVRAHNSRGIAYYNKRDYNLAIEDFEASLRIEPNNSLAKEYIDIARKALESTPSAVSTPVSQPTAGSNVEVIEYNYSEEDFNNWYKANEEYNKGRWSSLVLYIGNLSRENFVFTIGYDGPKAVVDTYSRKKYGTLSTSELAKKGLFRQAVASAVYSENQLELKEVVDIYNKNNSGPKYESNDLLKVFGVPTITKTTYCKKCGQERGAEYNCSVCKTSTFPDNRISGYIAI